LLIFNILGEESDALNLGGGDRQGYLDNGLNHDVPEIEGRPLHLKQASFTADVREKSAKGRISGSVENKRSDGRRRRRTKAKRGGLPITLRD